MLSENKFSKYLLYAFGEIILVMIGILLALQVNNWNENRKLNDTVNRVYTIIQSDLLSDIGTIDEVLNSTATLDSIFQKVLSNEITYDDYKTCQDCRSILYGFPDIKLNNRGIQLLEENSTKFYSNLDGISIEIIRFYNYFNTEIDVATIEISLDFNDNYSYFKNNMPWFEDFINRESNDEFIEYALTSSDYKNRVVSFHLLYYKIYLGHLKKYKENAQLLIKNIDEEVK